MARITKRTQRDNVWCNWAGPATTRCSGPTICGASMDCGRTEHFTVRSWSWTSQRYKSKDRPPLQAIKFASKMQASNTTFRYYHWQMSKGGWG
jgi:hypothetical protein